MTAERFARLIISDEVNGRIRGYRARLPELQQLKAQADELRTLIAASPDPKLPMNADLKAQLREVQAKARDISSLKTGLPVLMYQATFDETVSKKGFRGRWRKQAAARLNGLFMMDVDHVDDPRALFASWDIKKTTRTTGTTPCGEGDKKTTETTGTTGCAEEGKKLSELSSIILLVHITPSGHGLRIVATASAERGNLADNQAWLAKVLGVEADEACKDASRCSFCPGFEDILYINKEKLFTYENTEYDEKYGPLYRGGHSQPVHTAAQLGNEDRGNTRGNARCGTADTGRADGAQAPKVGGTTAEADGQLDERLKRGYHGKSYKEICEQWFRTTMGGRPAPGDRHRSLLSLAADLRYITDNNAHLLARVLEQCDVGAELCDEGRQKELADIADSACKKQMWRSIPRRFQPVLSALGIQLDGGTDDPKPRQCATVDYAQWWRRLEPLLGASPVLREAVAPLPDEHKLAGLLAAGAMLGTYLTRTWWEHFDGKDYRLSFLVYIIGGAASGKSFVTQLDQLIMAPMMAADRVGREWERQYREEMKKRAASSKNAKQEAPEQQHPVIRYVPSTISNAMLYRRLTDALDNEAIGPDGQPMHLHCYTCEAELATALRAQQGSWAGKLDLECKSFQNEVAGVDYANDQSVNGIIQVNWNQVVTGTPDAMSRKIRPGTVLDGLVTRLVIFPMPQNDFAMIERRRAYRDPERECLLRSIGLRLEEVTGELKAERLVDFCYQYEAELAREARIEEDLCLDYFRKRIPLIMMRYTLVRMVCRCLTGGVSTAAVNNELTVEDSDLDFARLIGDFCLFAQMHMFGQQVMDALEAERQAFTPRRRSQKVRDAYRSLPMEGLTTEMLVDRGIAKSLNAAAVLLSRLLKDGLLAKMPDGKTYRKLFREIPI